MSSVDETRTSPSANGEGDAPPQGPAGARPPSRSTADPDTGTSVGGPTATAPPGGADTDDEYEPV